MDMKSTIDKAAGFLKKYRYAALVLVIGLVLMSIPGNTNKSTKTETQPEYTADIQPTVTEKLESILSKIDGAGSVEVMLTIQAGEETIYQTNQDISISGDSNSSRTDTVTINDGDRNETGMIKQINPATYKGALIVCKGAESPAVKLAIIEAVSKITGLRSDQICVLKMK